MKAQPAAEKRELPEGLWTKCPTCSDIIYRIELEKNLWVCGRCNYHFSISARQYVELLVDPDSFEELWRGITSLDPLEFRDAKEKYRLKLKKTMLRTNLSEAVLTGGAQLHDREIMLCVFDFAFLGGSMGSAVGEKIARAGLRGARRKRSRWSSCRVRAARACTSPSCRSCRWRRRRPCWPSCTRRGCRSSRSSAIRPPAACRRVSPCWATSIIAEPKAQIGFAGPRVIRETINQELPEGFQTAEFVQECGFVDLIVGRARSCATC